MPHKEFSAGAIIFRKEKTYVFFLLIYSGRNKIWGFPKGHIESGETQREAALREIKEETGLCGLDFIPDFREEDVYETRSRRQPDKGATIEKHSIYFMCETQARDITVDHREITDYQWVDIEKAKQLILFEGLQTIAQKAYDRIVNNASTR